MSSHVPLRYLIVPGLYNSGRGHWQSHWQSRLGAQRVEQDDWSQPDLEAWSARVVAAVRADPRPAVLIAHSFGTLASVQALSQVAPQVHGLLLVAPAAPEKFGLAARLPKTTLPRPSLLAASQTDPWLSLPRARALAASWGSRFVNLGDAGHVNVASGHGPWESGLELLAALHVPTLPRRLAQPVPARLPAAGLAAGFAW